MKKFIEKIKKIMLYKKVLKQIQNEVYILELRAFLNNVDLKSLKKAKELENDKEKREQIKKAIETKINEISQDINNKIMTKQRIFSLKQFINNLK